MVSHDITLDQLSRSVLNHLVLEAGAVAWLCSRTGLVIGVTDPALAGELDRVNSEAGKAVLHYLTGEQLQRAGAAEGKTSATGWVNEVNGQLIERAGADSSDTVFRFVREHRRVLAARTALTGWFVVLADSME